MIQVFMSCAKKIELEWEQSGEKNSNKRVEYTPMKATVVSDIRTILY